MLFIEYLSNGLVHCLNLSKSKQVIYMKYIKRILWIVLMGSIGFSQVNAQEHKAAFEVVCEVDKDGKVVSGSIDELVKQIQQGNTVRIGWVMGKGKKHEMWHWADASFITILKGHVFAQIRGIFAQATDPISETPSVFLHSEKPNSWVAVFGTTGVMRQKFMEKEELTKAYKEMGLTDKEIKEQLKKQETRNFYTKWAVRK